MNHDRNGDQSEGLSLNDPGRMKGNPHPHCHHDPTSHHSRQRIWGPGIDISEVDGENQTPAMSRVVWLFEIEDHDHTGEVVWFRWPVAIRTIVVGERC